MQIFCSIFLLFCNVLSASEVSVFDIMDPTPEEKEVSRLISEYCSPGGFDVRAFLKSKDLSLAELKEKYKDHPDIVTYLYAFKILTGKGGVKQSDEMAARFFLSLVPSMPAACGILWDLCRQERCDFNLIDAKLSSLDPVQSNKNIVKFYDTLLTIKTTPFELKEKIRDYFNKLEDVRPDLAFMRGLCTSDFHKKFTIASRMAEKNYVPALITMAESYTHGIHTRGLILRKDDAKVIEYFQRAADAGDVLSLFRVGLLYWDYNKAKAITCFKQGAAKDSSDAITQLGIIALEGFGDDGHLDEPDFQKAFEYFSKSAEMGDALAYYKLGFLYGSGLVCEPDLEKSREYFQKVLHSPDDPNVVLKAHMYNYGTGVEEDPVMALKYYTMANSIFTGHYAKNIAEVKEKIKEFSASEKEYDIQAPRYRAPKHVASSSTPSKKMRNLEQEAYARLRSQEVDFQRKLNEKFPSADGSEIQKVDLTTGEIDVFRPLDSTQVTIKMPEDIQRRLSKGKRSFVYLERVQKWFDMLNSSQAPQDSEYMSAIRHAFPQKVDLLARLFGAYTRDEKSGKDTLALPGKLIPGETHVGIDGSFVYGFQGNELYHRFMHQAKCIA